MVEQTSQKANAFIADGRDLLNADAVVSVIHTMEVLADALGVDGSKTRCPVLIKNEMGRAVRILTVGEINTVYEFMLENVPKIYGYDLSNGQEVAVNESAAENIDINMANKPGMSTFIADSLLWFRKRVALEQPASIREMRLGSIAITPR